MAEHIDGANDGVTMLGKGVVGSADIGAQLRPANDAVAERRHGYAFTRT